MASLPTTRVPSRFFRLPDTVRHAQSSWIAAEGQVGNPYAANGGATESGPAGSYAPGPGVKVLQEGDPTKSSPFTIVFIANPALESPWNSGNFQLDPILSDPSSFDACVAYAVDSLFSRVPGQQELLLADPAFAARVRILSVYLTDRVAADANALVAEDYASDLLIARRQSFVDFLNGLGLSADVVYAVSNSASHTRASAWFTSDNDAGPGYDFVLDGVRRSHRFYNLVPGTVALHASARAITALHEFGHALSSYTNGSVVDLYVDSDPALNNKRGRPIPNAFATYESSPMISDVSRDGIGYPDGWQSYHCERPGAEAPAIMDNYYLASGGSVSCMHDRITEKFLQDRLIAKLSR
jgi:hypothetical protein